MGSFCLFAPFLSFCGMLQIYASKLVVNTISVWFTDFQAKGFRELSLQWKVCVNEVNSRYNLHWML